MARASKPCNNPGCPNPAIRKGKCTAHLFQANAAHNARTNARYSNPEYQRNKKLARKRDNNRCRVCRTDKDLSVHHVVPIRDGGTHALGNLVTLCRPHHDEAERRGRGSP